MQAVLQYLLYYGSKASILAIPQTGSAAFPNKRPQVLTASVTTRPRTGVSTGFKDCRAVHAAPLAKLPTGCGQSCGVNDSDVIMLRTRQPMADSAPPGAGRDSLLLASLLPAGRPPRCRCRPPWAACPGGRAALAVPVAVASVRPPVLAVRRARQPGGITALAAVNVLRTPGRALVGAVSLAVGVTALALSRVAAGGTALDPEVVTQLLGASRRTDGLGALTGREREVLGLMAEGRSNGAIAGILVVSERAVEKHVGNIFSKLGLAPSDADHRRVLAVLRYLES
jgi:DNA-binding CsgD family transcriptional regulator